MRSILAALLVLVPATAFAGHRGGGGGGGGGALSHVSSGLGQASSSSGSSHSSSSAPVVVVDTSPTYVERDEGTAIVDGDGRAALPQEAGATPPAHIDAYVGVQKVHDSNTAFTAELGVSDRWGRIGGQITQFSESQGEGNPDLKLSLISGTVGFRIDGHDRRNKAFLEVGLVGAKTSNDPVMDTSWVGGLGGLRLESKLAPHLAFVGTAQLMLFEDNVRATAASAGVRVGPLQASLRVVDFNVGPALWGPEVGLRF